MRRLAVPNILGCLLLACTAACQPIPRPFEPLEKGILLQDWRNVSHFSLFLAGIDGVNDEWEHLVLAKLSFYLAEMGILSSRNSANRGSMILRGHLIEGNNASSSISWEILEPAGEVIALFEQTHKVRSELIDDLSQDAASRIRSLLDINDKNRLRAEKKVIIFLSSVDGAPGDGKFSLREAMRFALSDLGITVTSELGGNAMSILGSVSKTRVGKNELIEVRWSLIDTHGVELASVVQNNSVPRGSLDGNWGDIAKVVADSGAQTIALLIENYAEKTEANTD